MALIGQIRKNSWILIIAIALGLGGFLIMDMNSAQTGPGGGASQLVVGTVNGEKIRRTEFEKVHALRFNGSTLPTYQNRNSLWNWFIEDGLLKEEADALGFGVPKTQINELEFGNNPSPIIRRNFPNPQQPGAINTQQLTQIKTSIDNNSVDADFGPGFRDFWLMQRDMIVKERLQATLQGMVQKAMYTPSWMAEMGYAEQNQTVDFNYVKIPYEQIGNEEVSVSDSDLSSYLSANRARFERKEEERVVEYITFDVIPTPADSAELRNKMIGLVEGFRLAENGDSNFVLQNEGIISPAYSAKEDLGTAIADTVMSLPIGSVYGPYVEGGEFRLLKVIDRADMADTINFRHILLGTAQSGNSPAQASVRADSMITVLRSGAANFDSLAVKFSQDPGTANSGGKYENVTANQFAGLPALNKVISITGNLGTYYKVRTAAGVHVVEILSRSASSTMRANVAFIREAIVPSKDTQDNVFQQASEFIANNRDLEAALAAAQASPNLRAVKTGALDKNAYELGQLGFSNDTKDAICWAFSADPGDVSPSVYTFTDKARYYDNKYVVIGLSDVYEAGLPSVDQVRADLESEVIRMKKAALVQSRIAGKELSAIATEFGTTMDAASGASFDLPTLPNVGNEPKVIAAALGLEQGQVSGAIEGASGIFVVQTTNKPVLGQATNLPQIRQTFNRTAQGWVASSFMSLLRESADVEDNRNAYECN
jgi:peptidyl-prolyl cis-trans isomerase D